MGPRRQMRPPFSVRDCLVIVAACALALAFTSRAFSSAPASKAPISNVETHALLRGRARVQSSIRAESGNASWHFAGYAAFLMASGVQALWARRIQTSRAGSRKAVRVITSRHAAAPRSVQLPSIPGNRQIAAPELPDTATAPLPKAIETDDLLNLGCNFMPRLSPSLTATPTEFVAGASVEGGAAGARRGCAARRVGASRCRSARKAASGAAHASAKASRRHVGTKLMPATVPGDAAPPSFDFSKLRTQIQLGLRKKSSARSASARESKTAATGAAASSASRVYFQINGFASMNTAEN